MMAITELLLIPNGNLQVLSFSGIIVLPVGQAHLTNIPENESIHFISNFIQRLHQCIYISAGIV
jgi:hypothetical protein